MPPHQHWPPPAMHIPPEGMVPYPMVQNDQWMGSENPYLPREERSSTDEGTSYSLYLNLPWPYPPESSDDKSQSAESDSKQSPTSSSPQGSSETRSANHVGYNTHAEPFVLDRYPTYQYDPMAPYQYALVPKYACDNQPLSYIAQRCCSTIRQPVPHARHGILDVPIQVSYAMLMTHSIFGCLTAQALPYGTPEAGPVPYYPPEYVQPPMMQHEMEPQRYTSHIVVEMHVLIVP